MIARILAGAALAAMAIQTAHADDGEAAFRATYKELVETNTTLSSGSCTLAAQRMGAHLAAAAFAPGQITYFATPEHPKEGGLVAVLPGTSPTARPILLLAMIDGGHATNALPQRAGAIVNCRIFPGHSFEQVRATLAQVLADPKLSVVTTDPDHPIAKAPPMDSQVIGPIEALTARYYPGVPLVPTMSTGATDGIYLESAGIPTYGVPGIWANPDLNGIHGLNEHLEVASLLKGRAFLFDLVQAYAK